MEQLDEKTKEIYAQILKEELLPAMGCTEPIAVAYCAAKARAVLGAMPERVLVEASGNIIKNVKSVIVPNTDGMKGIQAAAAAGIVAGREDLALEVISQVTPEQRIEIAQYLEKTPIKLRPMEDCDKLDVIVTVYGARRPARVRKAMMVMILGYTAVMWSIIILIPNVLIGIFSSDETLIQAAVSALKQMEKKEQPI